MKKYKYKAKKGVSEVVEGFIEADSHDNALDQVSKLGFLPMELVEVSSRNHKGFGVPMFFSRGKIKPHDLAQFYRQFSKLIKSGMPILKALSFLGGEQQNSRLKEIVVQLEAYVKDGKSLREAMEYYPKVFLSFDLGMIAAGEKSAHLEDALNRIAEYRMSQETFRIKVQGALIYPGLVFAMGVFSVIFIMSFVIPQFSSFFLDLGQELPLPTKILISISTWMKKGWLFLLAGVVMVFLYIRGMLASESKREKLDDWFLKLPLLGKLFLKMEMTHFARGMEVLLKSNISVVAATRSAISIIQNTALRRKMKEIPHILENGGTVSNGLMGVSILPSFFTRLVSVGETSGRLHESFEEIADWYELEVAETTKMMTNLIEPLMILVVGLVLGFVVMAILLPIFNMNAMI